MVVLGFEDREGGRQVRIVDRDLVGGVALKDEEPDRVAREALWKWRDADGTTRNVRPKAVGEGKESEVFVQREFPPDGGIGLKLVALWSYYPDETVVDELMFPKGAEVREAEDINGDWFWGVYAGSGGLFPGNYARVIGRV